MNSPGKFDIGGKERIRSLIATCGCIATLRIRYRRSALKQRPWTAKAESRATHVTPKAGRLGRVQAPSEES